MAAIAGPPWSLRTLRCLQWAPFGHPCAKENAGSGANSLILRKLGTRGGATVLETVSRARRRLLRCLVWSRERNPSGYEAEARPHTAGAQFSACQLGHAATLLTVGPAAWSRSKRVSSGEDRAEAHHTGQYVQQPSGASGASWSAGTAGYKGAMRPPTLSPHSRGSTIWTAEIAYNNRGDGVRRGLGRHKRPGRTACRSDGLMTPAGQRWLPAAVLGPDAQRDRYAGNRCDRDLARANVRR